MFSIILLSIARETTKFGMSNITENFLNDVTVPLNPFLGIIGTAPEDGEYGMIPPQTFGGNMDNRFLRAGSTLYLPVNVPGALISFSDPHVTQGDGEVCGTAIETSCTAVVTIELIKNKRIKYPRIESTDSMTIWGYIQISGSIFVSTIAGLWSIIRSENILGNENKTSSLNPVPFDTF